jgi:DNA-binding CsgD family transcriptional regulator
VRALTVRQRQVLNLVAAGHTSAQIGRQFGIAGPSVQRHLHEIYQQLGAHDRAHAVALAIHHGHITLAELAAIAGASTVRDAVGLQKGLTGARSGRGAAGGARDVQGAANESGGRTAARGEAAA